MFLLFSNTIIPNTDPVVTVPGSQTITSNETLTFTGATEISVSDSEQTSLEITITCTNGTATLSGVTGLTFTTGDGTDDVLMVFSGLITSINTALDGMIFTPDAVGPASIEVAAEDSSGGTGSGSVGITVNASVPTQSIQFVRASSQSLSMSNTDFGAYDHAKLTIAGCFKLGSIGTSRVLCSQYDGVNNAFYVTMVSSNRFEIRTYVTGTTVDGHLTSNATFSDTGVFYGFMLWVDTANATAGDRLKMWIGPVGSPIPEITSFLNDDAPTAALQSSTADVVWGNISGGSAFWDGLNYYGQIYSGVNIPVTDIFDAVTGMPKYVGEISGLHSALDVAGGDVTHDAVLPTAWTNNNSATASSTIP